MTAAISDLEPPKGDATAALVTAVSAGGTVRLASGTFRLARQLTLKGPLTVEGAGAGKTVLLGSLGDEAFLLVDGGDVVLRELTVRRESKGGDAAACKDGRLTAERCAFENGRLDANGQGGGASLRFYDTARGVLRGCSATGAAYAGVVVQDQAQVAVEDCEFSGNPSGMTTWGPSAVTVTTCRFLRNAETGLRVSGETTVDVSDSTFDGNLIGIQLQWTSTGVARGNRCVGNGRFGICVLEKCRARVEHNECSYNRETGILVANEAAAELVGNRCVANRSFGISYADAGGGTARKNDCRDNRLGGIYVGDRAAPAIDENVCENNESCGIQYADTAGGTASRNVCRRNTAFGIGVLTKAAPELSGNVCERNGVAGLGFVDAARGRARNNRCIDNFDHGILVTDKAMPVLEGNTCAANDGAGIRVKGGAAPDIGRTTYDRNAGGELILDAAKGRKA